MILDFPADLSAALREPDRSIRHVSGLRVIFANRPHGGRGGQVPQKVLNSAMNAPGAGSA